MTCGSAESKSAEKFASPETPGSINEGGELGYSLVHAYGAAFDNPDLLLLPGMYVQVDMPVEVAESVYLVPQEGVVRDRRGRPNVWVVTAENVIEERAINILQDLGNQWVVSEGLNPGDRIVVSGFQKTAPGATVTPEPRKE